MNLSNEAFRLSEKIRESLESGRTKEEIISLFSKEKRDVIELLLEQANNPKGELKNIIKYDDRYYHIKYTPYRVGKFKDKKYHNMFVTVDDDTYTIEDSGCAIDDDIVLVKIIDNKKKTASIEQVLTRNIKDIFGEVIQIDKDYYVRPENPKYKKLVIKLDSAENVILGSKVVVSLEEEKETNNYKGTVTGLIGFSNDPGIDILMETYKYGINPYFPSDVLEEANKLPLSVSEQDRIGRCDLTKKQIFTIDGDDTKDIDDAISLEITEDNHYLLGVHITDVTYYVDKNSALDREAYNRGTSSYLAGKVIPMYPAIISNGIGSLNPNVDRLTITCEMEFDQNGRLVGYNIYPSVINSNIQMTYRKVNDVLDEGIIPFGYEEYIETLKQMYKLSLYLKRNRIKRGAFDIERQELKINLDENGFPCEFIKRVQGHAENLIEEFMIAANETVAYALEEYNYPAMYRTHDEPSKSKVNEFIEVLNKIGMPYYKHSSSIQKEMSLIAEHLKEYGEVGRTMLLPFVKTLKKAKYNAQNEGHFGLASEGYLHFTSPIRRYPDDTVHRSIKKYLFSDEYKDDDKEKDLDFVELQEQAEYLSGREKDADRCEMAIIAMKCAEYMQKHIGDKFIGRIIQIDSKGMTIQLENLIEGRVKVATLPCHYEYNEETYSLVSLDENYEDYYYGDLVEVEVVDASKENKTIEFDLIQVLQQNKYIKPSVNDNKRNEAKTKAQRNVKRKSKRRTKWND